MTSSASTPNTARCAGRRSGARETRQASRRVEVSTHLTTVRSSRIVSALRSSTIHTVCTTSSAEVASSPAPGRCAT